MSVPLYKLEDLLKAQIGDRYVFAAEANRLDRDPEAFDCSELLEWGMEHLGAADFPDGSMNQRDYCHRRKKLTVAQAITMRGALLFRDVAVTGVGHVAYSLGNGFTVEARGSAYGVGRFGTAGREWTSGGMIPGLDYSATRPVKMVERWVCFGQYGGRWGQASQLRRLITEIRDAERHTGAAVVIHRKEPKDLHKARASYPSYRVQKRQARERRAA